MKTMGINGRNAIKKFYQFENEIDVLIDLYERI